MISQRFEARFRGAQSSQPILLARSYYRAAHAMQEQP